MSKWRDIPCWDGYQVSDAGEVVRKKDGIIVKQYVQKSGYAYVWLNRGYGNCALPVHRLVASAFLKQPKGKDMVDHINTIRHDNRLCNLRWVDAKGNANNEMTKLKRRKRYERIATKRKGV